MGREIEELLGRLGATHRFVKKQKKNGADRDLHGGGKRQRVVGGSRKKQRGGE